MTERQTVAGAYAKIDSHEEICALRYAQIASTLVDLKEDSKAQRRLLQTVLLAVAGFALATLLTVILFKSGLVG